MDIKSSHQEWQSIDSQIFWGEIAPCDHVVQIYEKDEDFLDLLENYIGDGIKANDSAVVIATTVHLKTLSERLEAQGLDVKALITNDQYIPLNAEETLSRFMVNGWPDEDRFIEVISNVIKRAKKNNRNVRAFGEMVAILWAKGLNGATVHLEHLWNRFCATETLCLFCAYPKAGLTQSPSESVLNICCAHAKIITGNQKSRTELFYKNTEYKKKI